MQSKGLKGHSCLVLEYDNGVGCQGNVMHAMHGGITQADLNSRCLAVCVSVFLSVYLSARLSVCLSVCLSEEHGPVSGDLCRE